MSQQSRHKSSIKDTFMEQGDWVQLQHQGLVLFSEGFKSPEVTMRFNSQFPLHSLFIVKLAAELHTDSHKTIHFNKPIVLIHRLSNKYLSYNPNFTNKSQFKLRTVLTTHCQFIIRPLYKCQSLRGSMVRHGQNCALSPVLSHYSSEQINLVVGRFQKNNFGDVPIFLKKNEQTALKIMRRNAQNMPQGSISNLQIYQLKHLQLRKWLSCSRLQDINATFVECSSVKNEYGTLFTFELQGYGSRDEVRIKGQDRVMFRFINSKKYLNFNGQQKPYLSVSPGEESIFKIELYNKNQDLNVLSLLNIRHINSHKYLSMSDSELILNTFNPYNVFQLDILTLEERRNILFINQNFSSLQQQFKDALTFSNKRRVTSILSQIIKFIYQNKNVYNQFTTLEPLVPIITKEQQLYFAQVGFLPLLRKMAVALSQSLKNSTKQKQQRDGQRDNKNKGQWQGGDYSEEELIFLYIAIIITGICKDNHHNLLLMTEDIKVYFEFVGQAKGGIQLLYHLFAFSSAGLEILEDLQFSFKKYQIKALQLLIEFICSKQLILSDRIKIVKFLRGCVMNERGQKIFSHEQVLISIFQQNRLKNILLTLSNNSDYELMVALGAQKQQLNDLLIRDYEYELQLQLLYEQISLLTTLCSRASKRHLNIFRDVISQEMILKYLQTELNSKFKSLFINILTSIYLNQQHSSASSSTMIITNPKKQGFSPNKQFRQLSNLSELSNKLLNTNQEQEMEDVNQNRLRLVIDFRSLSEIKNLIKQLIFSKIKCRDIGEQLISGLSAMKSFLEVGVCSQSDGQELIQQLIQFLSKQFKKKEMNANLVLVFLQILQYCIETRLKKNSQMLMARIRGNYRQGESRQKYCKSVVALYNMYVAQQLQPIIQTKITDVLSHIINFSLIGQYDTIFLRSTSILRDLNDLVIHFLEIIRNCIPIQSDLSHQMLKRVNKLYNALKTSTMDYIYDDRSADSVNVKKNIELIVIEVNEILQDNNQEQNVNILAQKIVAQFNFMDRISEFLFIKQRQLQNPINNALFKQIFKFIQLFLHQSEQNLIRNYSSIIKLKSIYKYTDRGQIKLLFRITTMKTAQQRLNQFLLDCWIMSIRHSFTAQLHIPLGFLILLSSNQQASKQQNMAIIRNIIINQQYFLGNLSKIDTKKIDQFAIKHFQTMQSIEYWLLYLVLVFRFIGVVVESETGNKALMARIKEYIPLKLIIRLLEEAFALQFDASGELHVLTCLLLRLIKSELINVFNVLYLPDLNQDQYDYLVYAIQIVARRLTAQNSKQNNTELLLKTLLYSNKYQQKQEQLQFKQTILTFIKLQYSASQLSLQILSKYNSNVYLFVNNYFSFIYKIYQKLMGGRTKLSISYGHSRNINNVNVNQLLHLMDSIFKKYKQFIHLMLNYSEYVIHHQQYSYSLKTAEQITKKKIGLNFNYNQTEQETESLLQGQQYFYNSKAGYLINSFIATKSRVQKYLYESLLLLLHSPKIIKSLYFGKHQLIYNCHEIYLLIVDRLKNGPALDFVQLCQSLCFYLQNNRKIPEWEPTLEYEQILKKLSMVNQDISNYRLQWYLNTQVKLLESYFGFEINTARKYQKKKFSESQDFQHMFKSFKQRVKQLINKQIQLHNNKLLLDQATSYFQTRPLNCEKVGILSIQLILQWLRLKISYSDENISRYFDVLLDVIALAKSYSKFISDFNSKYVPKQLLSKLMLCYNVLFVCVSGNNIRMLTVMIEQQIWNSLNILLTIDDSLKRLSEQKQFKVYDLLKQLTRLKIQGICQSYIQGVLQLYNNSLVIYGADCQMLGNQTFPLVPLKPIMKQLKYQLVLFIKQFRYLPKNISAQFFSNLEVKALDYNILNTYHKYQYFCSNYSISSVHTYILGLQPSQQEVADEIGIENAVEMTALKMHIQSLNGNYSLVTQYNKMRVDLTKQKKIRTFFSQLKDFCVDLVFLFIGICISVFRRRDLRGSQSEAVLFFMNKIGRVQLFFNQQLYDYQFMIFPQCGATMRIKQQFLNNLNFVSNQLKRQSVQLSIQRFLLVYNNDLQFYIKFADWKIMLFLARYIQVLKIVSYLLVITNNIIMIASGGVDFNQYTHFDAFQVITFFNFVDSLLILIVFLIKDAPLVLKIYQYDLSQGLGYFGTNFNQKSKSKQRLILAFKLMCNYRLLYNLIYTLIVALIFWDRLFTSILLLDVLAHIPSLNTLLLSIWRPKFQIILTILAYAILQYFFSILMYFLFRGKALGKCESLSECFGFIYFTTFKAVHGFVGYIFEEQMNAGNPISHSLSFFELFEDVYVLLIYQIMMALIMAIVIDSFIVAKAQKIKQQQYLNSACIVCNIDRSRFNIESKLSFKGHKSINHNIFNYFDFKYSITKKPMHLLNDFELFIRNCKTSAWIPDAMAMELSSDHNIIDPDKIMK